MDENKYKRVYWVRKNDDGLPVIDSMLQPLSFRTTEPCFRDTSEEAIEAYSKDLSGRLKRCKEDMVKLQREGFALDELARDVAIASDDSDDKDEVT